MAMERSDIVDELNPTVDVAQEEEEEEYTFRFESGMCPLEFLDNSDSDVQRYQQFERLADKKRTYSKKAREDDDDDDDDDISGATIVETRKLKKRGRRKGSKNKLNPQLTRMLAYATLHYACGRYDQAIAVLHEVVRLAPNLPDSYHTLGLVYSSLEDYKRAMDFYMIAAHLTPKNSSLWKLLFTWSIEQGDIGQASYCLSKAITADPKDIALRSNRAVLDFELGDYQKAAVAYEQVHRLCCENVDALNAEAKVKARIAQKQVAEENKRKAIMITTEKAELAASEGKPFCITRVDVGLDVAAVREAVTIVVEQKGLYVMVFSTDESTNKVVVCAGELDKGKLDVSEWLSNALGPLKGKCDKEKGVLATGQGTDASHVNEAIELAASFASMKFS